MVLGGRWSRAVVQQRRSNLWVFDVFSDLWLRPTYEVAGSPLRTDGGEDGARLCLDSKGA